MYIKIISSCHVETVCLLSKLHAKQHIEIDLSMDELDLTAAEKKATYQEIKDYVLQHSGLKVSNLYIVSAKYSCGFPDPQVLPIIVVDRYLDYFTTIMEDRLWQVLAKPGFRWRNRSGLSMNAAKAA